MSEYEKNSLDIIEHYFDIGKYGQVIEQAQEVAREYLANSRFWYILGYSNYVQDNFNEAEEQLMESMNLGYDGEFVYYVLGHIYMETERWQEAEEAFLEVLQLDPNDAVTHASYASLMKRTGHRKKAKLLIEKALELEPENAYVLRRHFILEGMNSSREQQILSLEQYINSDDSELSKLLHLGVNASFRGNTKEAKEHFRQAFLLKPEDKELLSILEDIEIAAHPLLLPNRIMERLGGAAGLWVIGVGMTFLLFKLGFEDLGVLWVQCYVVFALYTWVSEPLVKMLRKVKG
ncbi:MAG: tetratricopeptide repeat protein [Lysinibacillus sp.]